MIHRTGCFLSLQLLLFPEARASGSSRHWFSLALRIPASTAAIRATVSSRIFTTDPRVGRLGFRRGRAWGEVEALMRALSASWRTLQALRPFRRCRAPVGGDSSRGGRGVWGCLRIGCPLEPPRMSTRLLFEAHEETEVGY